MADLDSDPDHTTHCPVTLDRSPAVSRFWASVKGHMISKPCSHSCLKDYTRDCLYQFSPMADGGCDRQRGKSPYRSKCHLWTSCISDLLHQESASQVQGTAWARCRDTRNPSSWAGLLCGSQLSQGHCHHTQKDCSPSPLGLFSKLPDCRQGEQFRGRCVFGPIAAWQERVLNNCVIHQVPFV